MAEFPALPLWTDAYLGDTTHLTTIEHGAYLLLLMAMWRNGGSLPDNDKLLARYTKLNNGQWARISATIRPFFKSENGQIRQGRLTDELVHVKQHSVKQSNNIKARWLKIKGNSDTVVIPDAYHGNTPTPTPSKKKEIDKSISKEADGFEEFWGAVPRKVAKPEAQKAYVKALRLADAATLLSGIQKYAASRSGQDIQFTAHPATWLNQGRWKDEPAPAANARASPAKSGDERVMSDGSKAIFRGGEGWVRVYE